MSNVGWTAKKKKKIAIKTQKQLIKESFTVNDGDVLTLNDGGIEKLLGFLNNNKKALAFVYDNVVNGSGIIPKKTKDEFNEQKIAKYRLNAPSFTKNAKDNQAELIKNATPEEVKMKIILRELGIKYVFNKLYYTGMGYYFVDFYLPEYNVVLEIDGNQHLRTFDKEWDKLRTENLIYIHEIKKVVRIKNENMIIDTDVKNNLLRELDIK